MSPNLRRRLVRRVKKVGPNLAARALVGAGAAPGRAVVTIRRGRPSDSPELLALWSASELAETFTDDERGIVSLMRYDPGAVLVAEVRGHIVGGVIAAFDGWRGNVYRLAVAPEHQSQGIATRLMGEAEERFDELGCRLFTGLVRRDNDRSIALFTRRGYVEQSILARYARERHGQGARPSQARPPSWRDRLGALQHDVRHAVAKQFIDEPRH